MMMKTIQALLAVVCLLCTLHIGAQGDSEQFDIKFSTPEVDCDSREVCYFTQLRSGNGNAWNLAGQNYRIFYDASMASYINGSAERVLDPTQYSEVLLTADVQGVDASGFPGDLPFKETLSFLNYSVDLMSLSTGGINLPTDGSYVNTTRLCFEVTEEVVTNGSECLGLVWAQMGKTDGIATAFVEVSEWVESQSTTPAEGRIFDDLDADDGDASCIAQAFCQGTGNETTDVNCSDGLDNDEDGLLDCEDPDCAASMPCAEPPNMFEVALEVNSIDCNIGMVCYNVTVGTADDHSFVLGSQRYQLFYSSAVGTYVTGESLLGDEFSALMLQASTPIENVNATGVGPLPFESDLGFINFTIGLSDEDVGSSVLIEPGFPVTTAELCFAMSDLAIESDEACFEATWARFGVTEDYNGSMVEIDEWLGPNMQMRVEPASFGDISSADGDASCFDTTCPISNAEDNCTDGIDNDEDGLVDCFDEDCAAVTACTEVCNAEAPILTIEGDDASGFSCDFTTGQIDITSEGGNNTSAYATTYILTMADGVIVDISNSSPDFDIFIEGFFSVYAINFIVGADITGLSVGGNIGDIAGGDCFEISNAVHFNVCLDATKCDFCLGEPLVVNPTTTPDADRTTRIVLTDRNGVILSVGTETSFSDLDEGIYVALVVDFPTGATIAGLEVGQNVVDIAPGDIRITESFVLGVCDQLAPTIFFDLKGCDILGTAILQVGETFSTYEWSTGSTESFIEVSATEPMTYTVTVTLDNMCVGTATQEITGNEPTQLGDFVWEDTNGNGIQDAAEVGVNGITVNLFTDFNNDGLPDFADVPSCITTTTNHPTTGEPGYYEFFVYQSSYVVGFESPNGFVPTIQSQGDTDTDSDINEQGLTSTIVVIEGESQLDIDAGFRTTTTLCGTVWSDDDGDGRRDETEGGINDITINLFTTDGERISTTITLTDEMSGEDGIWCFENIPVQDYYVEVELPDGIVLTDPNVSTDENRDSDADGSFGPGTTGIIMTTPGEVTTDVGFGIYLGGVTCGVVWRESEQGTEGIFDAGVDSVLVNSQIEVIDANTGETVGLSSTDADGRYCVNGIRTGSYQVRFRATENGEDYVQPFQGDDPLVDSDVDINTALTSVFFVGPSDTIQGVNAGIRFGTLPVDLISFTGYWDPLTNDVELSWATASEINNDFFQIERVVRLDDGWISIGEVDGNGTTTDAHIYAYTDGDIAQSGTYFYRLKQVDYDEGYEYSDIIKIEVLLNSDAGLRLYPNPAHDKITLDIMVITSDIAEVSIYDFVGRKVTRTSTHEVLTGHNRIPLDITSIPAGAYLVRVQMGAEVQQEIMQITR